MTILKREFGLLYNHYIRRYDEFPITIIHLEDDKQDQLIDILITAEEENRELTKNEIELFDTTDIKSDT